MSDLLLSSTTWFGVAAVSHALVGLHVLVSGGGVLLPRHRLAVALAGAAWGLVNAADPVVSVGRVDSVHLAGEIALATTWCALLYRLLRGPYHQSMPETVRRGLFAFLALLALAAALLGWLAFRGARGSTLFYPAVLLGFALVVLALATQLARDAPIEDRSALRWVTVAGALAGGGLAAPWAIALLAPRGAAGFVELRALPLAGAAACLLLAVRLRPQWSLAVFVSPQARAYAPRFLGMLALFLVALALVPGFRALPPPLAPPLATVLVLGIGAPLGVVLFSERISARVRVFISKHFLPFRYDYREEWLRLIDTLASPDQRLPLPERAIMAVAQIVGSPAGLLWLRREDSEPFTCAARWNTRIWPGVAIPAEDPVLAFMQQRNWILDTAELNRDPGLYDGLERPAWLDDLPDALLLVPLISQESLLGFLVLFQSSSAFRLTFEEIDLLRTSGRQVAAYLAQYQADRQLAEIQQFEAFNRLTAFVMHDLKNLIAQQSLVVRNAARHKNNPAFFEDAIATIDNSVARMSKLLRQLQSGDAAGPQQRVRLADAAAEAVARTSGSRPQARLEVGDAAAAAMLDRERFITILSHLIRNAQDATDADGQVVLRLYGEADSVVLAVEDDGCGMDPDFLRNRLFRPFDTTKGSKGMGIGAYQVRTFVQDSGGRLDVWSEPGRGTRFTMRLPRIDPAPRAPAESSVDAGAVTAAAAAVADADYHEGPAGEVDAARTGG